MRFQTRFEGQLLLIARDVGYLNSAEFGELEVQIEIVGKLLTGLTRSVRSR